MKLLSLPASFILLLVSSCLIISSFADLSAECNHFVLNHCANETFDEDTAQSYLQSLSYLFQNLTSQSAQSKFFKTTSGSGQSSVSGLFRCREELSNQDCHNCVKKLPEVTKSVCRNTKSARVQLSGCYMSYNADEWGVPDLIEPEPRLRYTKCEEHEELPFGFRELMDAGFLELEHGIWNSHDGYYSTDYELVHMLAQCEEGFRGCECGECISHAVQIAQEECQHSASGEIYMEHCYMRYDYYSHGIPHEHQPEQREYHDEHGFGKAAAIALGGVAALVLGVVFLLCIKSASKKDDDS
uniref:Gnk2-homologous domain-containing protein n=1 Tax=Kalanchoe fedtschenkoi TaxID=63787 RepID=A0A7N0VJP0_KALFE